MGRIITTVSMTNAADPARQIHCDGLIDTGAWGLTVPASWKDRLGPLPLVERIELVTADQRVVAGEVGGPVIVRIANFRPVSTDVVFTEMGTDDPAQPVLIGYTVLEQAGIAVDVVRHQLMPVPYHDLKAQRRVRCTLHPAGV
jgi:predicted aspartyl protease